MNKVVRVDVPGLVAHLEAHLGPVTSGWMKAPNGTLMPFQVVRLSRGPDIGSVSYTTLGFSRRALTATDGTARRQELVVLATKSLPVEYVLGMVGDVARSTRGNGRALRQGDVIPLPSRWVPGSAIVAAYVAAPVYLDDSFAVFANAVGQQIEMLWLVPITAAEAEYVRVNGWEAFEELLAAQDPDLVDVRRAEVDLAQVALAEVGLAESDVTSA